MSKVIFDFIAVLAGIVNFVSALISTVAARSSPAIAVNTQSKWTVIRNRYTRSGM